MGGVKSAATLDGGLAWRSTTPVLLADASGRIPVTHYVRYSDVDRRWIRGQVALRFKVVGRARVGRRKDVSRLAVLIYRGNDATEASRATVERERGLWHVIHAESGLGLLINQRGEEAFLSLSLSLFSLLLLSPLTDSMGYTKTHYAELTVL